MDIQKYNIKNDKKKNTIEINRGQVKKIQDLFNTGLIQYSLTLGLALPTWVTPNNTASGPLHLPVPYRQVSSWPSPRTMVDDLNY